MVDPSVKIAKSNDPVAIRLEEARKELLDLSLYNRMLNFKLI